MAVQLSIPESASLLLLVLKVSVWLYQPLWSVPRSGVTTAVGGVLSMLMPVTLAESALLPAASSQLPFTDWFAPSVVTVTSKGLEAALPEAAPVAEMLATPEVASVQVNSTPTFVLFQPLPLAGLSRLAVRLGFTVSIFTTTGIGVEPVEAPVLLALSVAVQEMLWLPSPATLMEPLV